VHYCAAKKILTPRRKVATLAPHASAGEKSKKFDLMDKSIKHWTNGSVAIAIQKGTFESTRIQVIQEAIS